MSIEEKLFTKDEKEKIKKSLEQFEIKKILVVDDTEENIVAAKECLKELSDYLGVDYAKNTKEAKELLKKGEYDYVITDLKMEEKYSGLEVVKEAIRNYILPLIVTGYTTHEKKPDGHDHLTLWPLCWDKNKGIEEYIDNEPRRCRKDQPEAWKKVLLYSLEFIDCWKKSIDSLRRAKKYDVTLSEESIKEIMSIYNDIKRY